MNTIRRVYKNLNEVLNIREYLSKVIKDYWLYILIILGVIGIFYFSFKLEINHNKANGFLDLGFWLDNLIPNILADMIGIILTTFIITGLIAQGNKKAEEKRLYGVLGLEFERLVNVLCRNYLYLVRKDTYYMNAGTSEEKIKEAITVLAKEQNPKVDFFELYKPFEVWDISQGSYLYDTFAILLPKIKEHKDIQDFQYKKTIELSYNRDLAEYYLKHFKVKFGEDSFQYKKKLIEYEQLKQDYRNAVFVPTPIKEDHLHVDIERSFEGLARFYKIETDKFSERYNAILPIDVRLIFSEIEQNISSIAYNIYQYNHPKIYIENDLEDVDSFKEKRIIETMQYITIVAQQLLKLINYFSNTKRLFKI
ncbi:hypothetical protein ACFW1J_26100 [Priestia aryabhattai]|uniref:hypothetical protein n=1 Tax=Priestia aryabhattai TaxID=412384 RepID=UPI00366F4963